MCIALCTQNASILIVIADLLWLEQRYVDIFFASRALHGFTILAFLVVRSLYHTVLHKRRLRLIADGAYFQHLAVLSRCAGLWCFAFSSTDVAHNVLTV